MKRRSKAGAAGAAVAGVLAVGILTAMAVTGDDSEQPIVGADLEQASAAALEYTGGGRVTGTEVGDEESLYEVEVTLDDGTQVDVQLDGDFHVVGDKVDSDTTED